MPKRAGSYAVPFPVTELSYDDALAIARDIGQVPPSSDAASGSGTGPLLEIVVDMLDVLERPDEHFDCLQIAGTNGKTSTSRFTAAILRGEGLRTALYTSPQLVNYEERIEVDGAVISPDVFAHGVSVAAEAGRRANARRVAAGKHPHAVSPFDVLTVAALVIFAEARIDVAVLEVGLGGRWDATSATDPVAVAITGIGLDHMRILGDTLAEIAGEKAAIIKPGRTVVLGEGTHESSVQRVMDERCAACGVSPFVVNHALLETPAHLGDELTFSTDAPHATYRAKLLKPSYQAQNAACAIALAEAYLDRPLDTAALDASLLGCPTPGRFDVLRTDPLVLIDACHNPQSCENFVASLDEIDPDPARRPVLLIAALADKDVAGIADVLVPAFPKLVVTATASERALPPVELATIVLSRLAADGRTASDVLTVCDTVEDAVAQLTAAGTPFIAAGTITLAGEVAALFRN